MKPKVLVFDLDGTLLTSKKEISNLTALVINKCSNSGILIVFATSRSEASCKRFCEKINPDYLISNGGALVKKKNRMISQKQIDLSLANKIIEDLLNSDGIQSITVDTPTGYYVSWQESKSIDYRHGVYHNFRNGINESPYKITIETKNDALICKLKSKYDNLDVVKFSDGDFYRFAHENATKENAILELSHYIDIPIDNFISFGDDYNDVGMIKVSGIGVAMGNAIDEVKIVSDMVCDTNDKDGIAKWILANLK